MGVGRGSGEDTNATKAIVFGTISWVILAIVLCCGLPAFAAGIVLINMFSEGSALTAGIVVVVIGSLLMLIGLICLFVSIYYASKRRPQTNTQGTVLQVPMGVAGGAPPGYVAGSPSNLPSYSQSQVHTTVATVSYPGAPSTQGYGQQPGYPGQQAGYPGQQAGYPPQHAGYPPQQAGYPPQQAGHYPRDQPSCPAEQLPEKK